MCLAAKHLTLVYPARLFPPPSWVPPPLTPGARRRIPRRGGAGPRRDSGAGPPPALIPGCRRAPCPGRPPSRRRFAPPLPWRPPAPRRTCCRATALRWCRDTPAPRWASTSARGRSSAPGAASGSTSPRLRR